ncbi:hypothetical protein [Nocardiopsis synnemataformans]|uniref:hypothetical protein n=1 Tax=Nocardiopsis synnemataformans TaxID=61305 RepID=UPI003EBD10B8
MSSIEDFEATSPDRWRIDGRPLTKEEMRAVLDMEPTDFMRYHLIQDERQADGGQASVTGHRPRRCLLSLVAHARSAGRPTPG